MNNNFKYPRWSEWRKWDLHVHTPESDWFSWDWEQFKEQLKNAECSVIWINDYSSIAWYRKLKQEINTWTFDLWDKVILPIVEMRMSDSLQNRWTTTNWSIHFNFHIIFSDEINEDDIETFIKWLESWWSIIWSDYLDKEKIKEKKVSFYETLKKLKWDPKFKDKFLIWLPYDEYWWIWDIDPNSDGWIKWKFIEKSDFLWSSNKKQIDFFLWESELKADNTPKITQEKFKEWLWNKKPCIKWSDSHSHTYPIWKLKDADSNPTEKYCWIKADPSFEWLKQVVYEPKDRIFIWESNPEEKKDYQVIDKVQFMDNFFTPKEILINQNLTTIIWWKSTWKSILLRNIAETIDSEEVMKRLNEVWISPYTKPIDNFKVTWIDWEENIKSSNETTRKIIYIPQSYLNRLVDKKEDKDSIDDIIKNILEQEDEIKTVFEDLELNKREIEKRISNNIDDLFFKEKDVIDTYNEIKKVWDTKWIQNEIDKLKWEVTELKEKSWVDKDDIEKYNELHKSITDIKNKDDTFNSDLGILKKFQDKTWFDKLSFISSETFLDWSFEDLLFWLSKDLVNWLEKEIDDIKLEANKKWKEKIKNEILKIDDLKTKNNEELKKLNEDLKPLAEKIAKSKSLEEKIKKLKQEEYKLKQIEELEEKFKKQKSDYYWIIKSIIDLHSKFYELLFNAKAEILKQKTIDWDLKFNIDLIPKNKSFTKDFIEYVCNLTKLWSFKDVTLNEYKIVNSADFSKDLEKIINWILRDKLELKKSFSKKEALTRLLNNWFVFDYKIKQWHDEISEMSPWKKSFVLLKLLIELDNSKCPILLDQPEDDLDNRSIYEDLVKFIKDKKKERQIIIATHNPNLVVWSDSECIIVANQKWDNSQNETYDFEYIEWSLENTFILDWENKTLYKQWIQEHVCDVLEWWKRAFEQRKNKYNISFN